MAAKTWIVVLLGGLVLGTAGPAAARTPSLTVRSVAAPAGPVADGSVVHVRAVVANAGAARAKRSRLAVFLSADRRRSPDDLTLRRRPRVRPVRAHGRVRVEGDMRVPEIVATGRRFVVACVRRRCASARRPLLAVTGGSAGLVGADPKLSPEQALIYKVFAVNGDPRLPARYRAAPSEGTDVMGEAVGRYDSLSPQARATLDPFLVPPAAAGSAANADGRALQDLQPRCLGPLLTDPRATPDQRWKAHPGAHGVTFWVRENDPQTEEFIAAAKELDAQLPHITSKLRALMGDPLWLSDDGMNCFHGGDGNLDVYFWSSLDDFDVPIGPRRRLVGASTVPYGKCTNGSPAFIMIADPAPGVFAHELMHAAQVARPGNPDGLCTGENWLWEGTASWFGELAYPGFEQTRTDMLTAPQTTPLDEVRGYSAWAWWYYLAKTHGDDVVRRVWSLLPSRQDELAATSDAIGGFEPAWHEFLRIGWNGPPVEPTFRSPEWLGLRAAPRTIKTKLELPRGRHRRSEPLTLAVPSLARGYVTLDVPPGRIREISFPDLPENGSKYAYRLFWRLPGGDWKEDSARTLCRDVRGEDAREIVLAAGNASRAQHDLILDPKVEYSDRCAALTRVTVTGGLDAEESMDCNFDGTPHRESHKVTMSWRYVYEDVDLATVGIGRSRSTSFQAASGHYSGRIEHSYDGEVTTQSFDQDDAGAEYLAFSLGSGDDHMTVRVTSPGTRLLFGGPKMDATATIDTGSGAAVTLTDDRTDPPSTVPPQCTHRPMRQHATAQVTLSRPAAGG